MRVTTIGELIERALIWAGLLSPPPISNPGEGSIYFDAGAGKFKVSENGGAYVDLVGGVTPVSDLIILIAGQTVVAGEFVYPSGTDTVMKGLATSLGTSTVIGVPDSGILIGNPGNFRARVGSRLTVQLETGLIVAEGDMIFLSAATAGAGTPIAPSTVGQVVKPLGNVIDASAYVGSTPANSRVDIIFQPCTGVELV